MSTKTFGSGSREIPANKASKWYPTTDVTQPKKARKTQHPTKLRASLVPGTILIILAGRFRGKRVVFLKALDGGVLLVTGPFKLNGVPLRRVNARYVIATSTKIELPTLDLAKYDDDYFTPDAKAQTEEEQFFDAGKAAKEKKALPETRTADQSEVDKALLSVIKQTPQLASYLKTTFSLSKGDRPHLMNW
ncbi:60S ribosomal protein L6-B [Drechslerella stenobrocha 248]|uniref:60S ribosomal protein L6 n=1 Tax=Drechslerella stenobrocha 248 TaxID=1043628 RepID=W7I9I3_9PEZI|nr:60S ribosomal protein L6-B [Drechslerella stenobrocha 248]